MSGFLDFLIGPRPPCKCGRRMVPLRRGIPIFACRCGAMQIGRHTVTLDGANNKIVWTATGTPTAAGDLGMNAAMGRLLGFILDESRQLALRSETPQDTSNRILEIQQNSGLTTIAQVGFATAPTANGTASLLETAIAQFINYASAATNNADAGWLSSAFSQTRFDYRPMWRCTMRTGGVITVVRNWLGLFASTPMASSDPAIDGAAFRYDTGVDGTAFWRTWTNDGAGGGTVTTTTVAMTVDTNYRLLIAVDTAGANVRFYINDVLVATHVANLPTAAVNLGHVEQVRTLENVAKSIRISKVALMQRAA